MSGERTYKKRPKKCRRKSAYPTKRIAEARAQALRDNPLIPARESIGAYSCACGNWHVGHTPKRKQEASS